MVVFRSYLALYFRGPLCPLHLHHVTGHIHAFAHDLILQVLAIVLLLRQQQTPQDTPDVTLTLLADRV